MNGSAAGVRPPACGRGGFGAELGAGAGVAPCPADFTAGAAAGLAIAGPGPGCPAGFLADPSPVPSLWPQTPQKRASACSGEPQDGQFIRLRFSSKEGDLARAHRDNDAASTTPPTTS